MMEIDCHQERMDLSLIHQFLTYESPWAKGISRATVEKSLRHSLCFAGYIDAKQMAFARVISDYATFANLVDVFILEEYRGKGFGKQLIQSVVSHPELQGLRHFTLATADAHDLYNQYGFSALSKPSLFMERFDPNIYSRESGNPNE